MERRCEVTRTSCVKLVHTRTRGPCLIMSLFSRCVFFFQWLLEETWYDQDKDKDIVSDLVTQLAIPDESRNSNHDIDAY